MTWVVSSLKYFIKREVEVHDFLKQEYPKWIDFGMQRQFRVLWVPSFIHNVSYCPGNHPAHPLSHIVDFSNMVISFCSLAVVCMSERVEIYFEGSAKVNCFRSFRLTNLSSGRSPEDITLGIIYLACLGCSKFASYGQFPEIAE